MQCLVRRHQEPAFTSSKSLINCIISTTRILSATSRRCDFVALHIVWRLEVRPASCRAGSKAMRRDLILARALLYECQMERCPSGLRSTLGKRVYVRAYRGFESRSLCKIELNCDYYCKIIAFIFLSSQVSLEGIFLLKVLKIRRWLIKYVRQYYSFMKLYSRRINRKCSIQKK